VSRASTALYQDRSVAAIRSKLSAGGCTVDTSHRGVVWLFAHDIVVWGVDQTASAELSADGTRIRCQRGPWVALTADEQRMAKMAAAVARTAAAAERSAAAAKQTVAAAMVGSEIALTDTRAVSGQTAPTQWVITHLEHGIAVAEPVGLTDKQRASGELLARRVDHDGQGAWSVIDRTHCLMYTLTLATSVRASVRPR